MKTPLLNALTNHVGRASYHTPGHKNGQVVPSALSHWGKAVFIDDVTEITGMDNLQHPQNTLRDSMAEVAKAYGAHTARYLAGGTTLGLLAALYAFGKGGKVLMPRHAHRSIYHGVCLAEAEPVYVPTALDSALEVPIGMDAEAFCQLLKAQKPQVAVFVRPTYHGYAQDDDARLIALAKAHGVVTVVDAAHGAHFAFSEAYPACAAYLGADITVMSIHKTLPALTQGSVALVQNPALVPAYDHALRLLQSTSPSYLVLAAMEAAIAETATLTPSAVAEGIRAVQQVAQAVDKLSSISVAKPRDAVAEDPLRLYLINTRTGGQDLARRLETYGIDVELSDNRGVLLLFPLQAIDHSRLITALQAIDADLASATPAVIPPPAYRHSLPQVARSIGDALAAPKRTVLLADALGNVAGDFLQVYPPGIPVAVPGEVIDAETVQALKNTVREVDIVADGAENR